MPPKWRLKSRKAVIEVMTGSHWIRSEITGNSREQLFLREASHMGLQEYLRPSKITMCSPDCTNQSQGTNTVSIFTSLRQLKVIRTTSDGLCSRIGCGRNIDWKGRRAHNHTRSTTASSQIDQTNAAEPASLLQQQNPRWPVSTRTLHPSVPRR